MREYTNRKVLEIIKQTDDEAKVLCVHGQTWDHYRANQA